jgi:hypothetical protein
MSATYYADSGSLWAITSYYNPNRYWRRRANYTQFRRHLDLPLLAVELNCGGRFELNEDDAEILIRCQAGDVMWQKERLLNIALAALPKECEQVAWIDCDLLFTRPDWTSEVRRQLQQYALVQPFTQVRHLVPDAPLNVFERTSQTLFTKSSMASMVFDGIDPALYLSELAKTKQGTRTPGLAWAARREVMEQCGLYDANIIGGGDTLLAGAAFGNAQAVVRRQELNTPQAEHYLNWAQALESTVRGNVGCVEQEVLHLWHGDVVNRRYRERFQDLRQFDFDPAEDIRHEPGGAWHWASDKPGLHALLRDYFVARNEDGAAQTLKAA